jgi:hypothetical protein
MGPGHRLGNRNSDVARVPDLVHDISTVNDDRPDLPSVDRRGGCGPTVPNQARDLLNGQASVGEQRDETVPQFARGPVIRVEPCCRDDPSSAAPSSPGARSSSSAPSSPGARSSSSAPSFSGGAVSFREGKFSGGEVSFFAAKFSGGEVNFSDPGDWSSPPKFSWIDSPPQGVKLPHKEDQSPV